MDPLQLLSYKTMLKISKNERRIVIESVNTCLDLPWSTGSISGPSAERIRVVHPAIMVVPRRWHKAYAMMHSC